MDRKATLLRFPPKLYERLIREAGERTLTTGKRVSVNEVIMEILEGYLDKKTRKRKGVK